MSGKIGAFLRSYFGFVRRKNTHNVINLKVANVDEMYLYYGCMVINFLPRSEVHNI